MNTPTAVSTMQGNSQLGLLSCLAQGHLDTGDQTSNQPNSRPSGVGPVGHEKEYAGLRHFIGSMFQTRGWPLRMDHAVADVSSSSANQYLAFFILHTHSFRPRERD